MIIYRYQFRGYYAFVDTLWVCNLNLLLASIALFMGYPSLLGLCHSRSPALPLSLTLPFPSHDSLLLLPFPHLPSPPSLLSSPPPPPLSFTSPPFPPLTSPHRSLLGATINSVFVPHLLWVVDALTYVFTGNFPIGLAAYIGTNRSTFSTPYFFFFF